jgi:hypothetical protein
MLLYSTVPLIGLALLSRKYAERQARLERQYQGHVVAAEKKLERISADGAADKSDAATEQGEKAPAEPVEYSTADDTIIPLTPLILIFLAVACFAAVMLARERGLSAGERPGDSSTNHRENASP